MGSVFVIWSRKEKCLVPDPYATFPTSQAANDHAKRIVKVAGDTKDKQNQTYDVLGPLTTI